MKRPSFQFYPADWLGNTNLRRCTHAERGIWIAVMCLMHDSDEYGVLRWPLRDIASAVNCKPTDLVALAGKGVLKGDDTRLAEAYVYVPRSGRRDGPPVVLIEAQDGPLWFCSRMVRDEHVRGVRGEGTRFGDADGATSKAPRMGSPKRAPMPPFGDGPTSSSSSTSTRERDAAPSAQPTTAMPNDKKTPKATRLCSDWVLPKAWGDWALTERPHWTADIVRAVADKFRDNWVAKSGKDAAKLDWLATWRNWVRNERDPYPQATGHASQARPALDNSEVFT